MNEVPVPLWSGASTNGWILSEQVSGLASHGLKLPLFACFQLAVATAVTLYLTFLFVFSPLSFSPTEDIALKK